MRLPSSRTRVRAGPRPRSETVARPSLAGLLEVPVDAATNCGNWFSVRSIETAAVCTNGSAGRLTSGLADSKSRLAMREPVTTTVSRSAATVPGLPTGSRIAAMAHSMQMRRSQAYRTLRPVATPGIRCPYPVAKWSML